MKIFAMVRLQNACIFHQNEKKYVEYLSQTTAYANDRVSKPQYIVAIVEYEFMMMVCMTMFP